MLKMKNFKLTIILLMIGLFVGVLGLNVAVAQEEYNLVLGTYSSESHITSQAFKFFAQRVREKTDGQVNFTAHYGTLAGAGDVLPLVKDGTVDIGMFLPFYYPAEFNLTSVKEMPYAAY
ncbi:MAG: hypothetical protein K9K32_02530, partial [Halanaerobiales bacterium]|nr:hypothetical protein [Halanaerobiales bacterium]